MKRVILSSFIALLIIGSIAVGYFYYQKIKAPHSEVMSAIPPDAAFILECKNMESTWQKLSQTPLWQELVGNNYFSNINQSVTFLDSAFSTNKNTQQFLENYPAFITGHIIQNKDYDLLFLINLPPLKQETFVNDIISSFTQNNSKATKRSYNGIVIRELPIKNKRFSYAVSKGIFMASFTSTLVEDAIRQLKVGRPVTYDNYFKQVYAASGRNVDANLYINYKVLPKLLATYLSKTEDNPDVNGISNIATFSNWTGLDLKIKPDGIMLNGFSSVSDSNNFLNIFTKLQPQKVEITKILPKKTAFMFYMGIDNVDIYMKNYQTYLIKNKTFKAYSDNIKRLNTLLGIDVAKTMTNWMDKEMALVITEPSAPSITNNTYAVFKSKNLNLTKESLKQIKEAAGKKEGTIKEEIYRDYPIGFIDVPHLLPSLFGSVYGKMEKMFYTTIDEYVVFGNQASSIRKFIDDNKDKKLLIKDAAYNNLTDHLETKTNLYIYVNIPQSLTILKAFASPKFIESIDMNREHFKKFNSLAIQFRSNVNMFYNNIYLQKSIAKTSETNSLWEAELDTTVSSRPFVVYNHKTKTNEVIVQDDANVVYLIDSIGEVLWKVRLEEPILSDIYQIDAFKNNRLQYMFNTASALHMLDRNGENVEDYPIRFKHKATNGIAVFDYEDNRDYRIYVAGEDHVVRAFQTSGKVIDGWKFTEKIGLVTNPVTHYRIEDNDYLLITDANGAIHILDRKGNRKVDIEESLNSTFNNPFIIVNKNNEKKAHWITTDSTGRILKVYLNGDVRSFQIKNFSSGHFFDYKDLDGDGEREYIFLNKNLIEVFKQDSSLVFSHTFENEITQRPQFIPIDGKLKIGISDIISDQLFLLNEDGSKTKGFPLKGSTPFSFFINEEGIKHLVTGSKDKNIYMYVFE